MEPLPRRQGEGAAVRLDRAALGGRHRGEQPAPAAHRGAPAVAGRGVPPGRRAGWRRHLPVAAYCDIVSEKDRGNDSNKNNRLKLLAMFGSEDGKQLARTEQVWDMTSDRNDIVERAVHDIRYKLEID